MSTSIKNVLQDRISPFITPIAIWEQGVRASLRISRAVANIAVRLWLPLFRRWVTTTLQIPWPYLEIYAHLFEGIEASFII